jgi:YHS domain-containing protein
MTEDLICGMVVDPETVEFRIEQDGQTYYFCSEACKGKFDRKPVSDPKKKGFFTRFLERIAKANTEKFGSEPPSCHGQ